MIDITTLSLKLDYFFGRMNYYPCARAEVVDESITDSLVLYKIEREAMLRQLTEVENADIAEIVEELIQKGVIFFFNEDERTVKIKQVENVWAKLKKSMVAQSVSSVPANTAETAETVNTVATTTPAVPTVPTVPTEEANTDEAVANETADTVMAGETEETEETAETTDESADEAYAADNTVDINEVEEAVEEDATEAAEATVDEEAVADEEAVDEEPAGAGTVATEVATEDIVPLGRVGRRVGQWHTAIVILGSDVVGEGVETDFIIEFLREKVIQAWKYDVTVLSRNPSNIWEVADEDEDEVDSADKEEVDEGTEAIETGEVRETANSSEVIADEALAETAETVGNNDTDETADTVTTDTVTTEVAITAASGNTVVAAESEETAEEDEPDEPDESDELGEADTRPDEITTINTLLFIIKELFHYKVFDFSETVDTFDTMPLREQIEAQKRAQRKEQIEALRLVLTGKHLFLVNKHKNVENVEAEGVMQGDGKGIVVKAGSRISIENRLPNQKGQGSSANLREKLIEDGIISNDYRFTSDYQFASTSAAASVILGQSASGMTSWKDERGIKLETLLGRG